MYVPLGIFICRQAEGKSTYDIALGYSGFSFFLPVFALTSIYFIIYVELTIHDRKVFLYELFQNLLLVI